MERYLTRRYAAVSWAEATRLAQLDLTEFGKIRHTRDVDLIHRTDWWAWWSDQQLTPAIGLPEDLRPQGLSGDAEDLITDVWASGGVPDCGWATLAAVRQIMRVETLSSLSGGIQCFSHRERLWIQFHDDSQAMLYRYWHWRGEDCFCNCSFQRVGSPN